MYYVFTIGVVLFHRHFVWYSHLSGKGTAFFLNGQVLCEKCEKVLLYCSILMPRLAMLRSNVEDFALKKLTLCTHSPYQPHWAYAAFIHIF